MNFERLCVGIVMLRYHFSKPYPSTNPTMMMMMIMLGLQKPIGVYNQSMQETECVGDQLQPAFIVETASDGLIMGCFEELKDI